MKFLLGSLLILSGMSILNPSFSLLGILAGIGAVIVFGAGSYFSIMAILGISLQPANTILSVDPLSGFFMLILSIIGGAVILNLWGDLLNRRNAGEKPWGLSLQLGLTFLFLLTMFAGLSVDNLGLIWVCVEGTTMVSALLIGFESHKASLEAAWKYVILCTVGLTFSLFGLILLLQGAKLAGIPGTLDARALLQAAPQMYPPLLKLSFVLMLLGYATKAGFAPLHSWLPDAHSQAPAPASALLSGVLLNISLYAIIRIVTIMDVAGLGVFCRNLLMGFGFLSILLATLFLLVQNDLKRMLAYSSIEHIGLITFGLGLGTPMAIFAVTAHIFGHSISKALAFLSAGELVKMFHSHDMNRMVASVKRLPVGGGGMAIALISLAGMPPFPLFFTELLLVGAAFTAGRILFGVLLLGSLAVAFTGLVFQGTRILLGEDTSHHHKLESQESVLHDVFLVDVDNEKLQAMKVGSGWRNFSMYFLTTILVFLPLIMMPPFSDFLRFVNAMIESSLK